MNRNRRGFALLMVLMVVAMAALLGITYMTTSTLKAASSQNLVHASRAKYLAESAVQHGVYLLRTDAAKLETTSASRPLGPFYVDDSEDAYTLWAQRGTEVGTWLVSGEGRCGQAVQSASATVFVGAGQDKLGGQTLVCNGTPVTIPGVLKIYGDVSVKGSLDNNGYIKGAINYSHGNLSKKEEGNHDGPVNKVQEKDIISPTITYADYDRYLLGSKQCQSTHFRGMALTQFDPLTKDRAATATNPGGVVYLEPPLRGLGLITANTDFTGTIVINGNVVLDGKGIRLKAKPGFPAIVCSGAVYVTQGSEVEIDGMVVSPSGVRPFTYNANAKTTIRGALLTQGRAYDEWTAGSHELHAETNSTRLYDVKTGKNTSGEIRIIDWYDQ